MKLSRVSKKFLFLIVPFTLGLILLTVIINAYRLKANLGVSYNSALGRNYLTDDLIFLLISYVLMVLLCLAFVSHVTNKHVRKFKENLKNVNLKDMDFNPSNLDSIQEMNDIEIETSRMIENIQLLTSAVEFNKDSIVITDTSGHILYVNESMCQWSGFDKMHILHRMPSLFKSGVHDVAFYKDMWDTINEGRVWHGRVFNRSKTNKVIPFSLTITPIKNRENKVTHFVGIHRNISQEIATEDALIKSQNEAIMASKSKTQFLSIMSHEIRTPLNAILGASEIISEYLHTEEEKKWVILLKSSTDALLQIVNDILDFSKIESGKIEIEKSQISICGLINEIKITYEFLAQRKKISFYVVNELDCGRPFIGDIVRLKQILMNLLNNAFKFTESGDVQLRIKYNSRPDRKGNLLFMIKDTGIGIAAGHIAQLFTPFMQADNSIQRKYGGSGLGLAICKQLVEKMGGEIWVESALGQGSTFYFSIDHQEEIKIQPHLISYQGATNEYHMFSPILIVDDVPENVIITGHFLKSYKIPYQTASSGKEALELIEKQCFPIIFLDIEMPEMSGLECVKKIKLFQKTHKPQSHIVALSGHVTQEIIDLALVSGFDSYLAKPVGKQMLYNKIKEVSAILSAREEKINS